jgi:hypothetical protein
VFTIKDNNLLCSTILNNATFFGLYDHLRALVSIVENNKLFTIILRQWCNMRNITDVYLDFFHRHWVYKHDVSKADCFRLQVNSFILHCLTTGPQPLPKRVLQRVRSSASSFNFQYPIVSLRSSSSSLRLLPHLPVISIHPSNFPSITCFRRQFLRKMWPIQLAFLLFIYYPMKTTYQCKWIAFTFWVWKI